MCKTPLLITQPVRPHTLPLLSLPCASSVFLSSSNFFLWLDQLQQPVESPRGHCSGQEVSWDERVTQKNSDEELHLHTFGMYLFIFNYLLKALANNIWACKQVGRWIRGCSDVQASHPVDSLPLGSLMSRNTNYVSPSLTLVQYQHPQPSTAPSLRKRDWRPLSSPSALHFLLLFRFLSHHLRRRKTFSPCVLPLFALKWISGDPSQLLCHVLVPLFITSHLPLSLNPRSLLFYTSSLIVAEMSNQMSFSFLLKCISPPAPQKLSWHEKIESFLKLTKTNQWKQLI